ncbi:unnamed protein product [Moneuplotes crassus]|uniref:Transmembrane protein n=1 Tax=Euplotes crassus TaxID=5936 RepID=A0AAD1XUD5_EUPCR|nr:unnamed protein product [Moneuplotes crassus]
MDEVEEEYSESEGTQTENSEIEEVSEDPDDPEKQQNAQNIHQEMNESEAPKSDRKRIRIKRKKKKKTKQDLYLKEFGGIVDSEKQRSRHIEGNISSLHDPQEDGINIIHKKNRMPMIPFRLLLLTGVLFISGIVLIIMGFISEVKAVDPLNGILCWVLAAIVLIPGIYYTVKVIQVMREPNPNIRKDIIGEIF